MEQLSLSASDRILIAAPHPDDETLATGGLIQRAVAACAAVRVVFATRGENNLWPQRLALLRWSIDAGQRLAWGQRRRREALAALRNLGLDKASVVFLRYPHRRLTQLLLSADDSLTQRLIAELRVFRPTLVVSPALSDLHPDHNALALYVQFALDGSAAADTPHLAYTMHGSLQDYASEQACYVALNLSEQRIKRRSVLAHGSQMILSRRRLLKFVTGQEMFIGGADTGSANSLFQVYAESARRIVLQAAHSSLEGSTVSFIAPSGLALQVTLPTPLRAGPLASAAADPAECIELELSEDAAVLNLPERFGGAQWAKIARRWHLLDSTGWQKLYAEPLPARRAVAICCVIPCYNAAHDCGSAVRAAARYADYVIAIDDGSSDETRRVLESVAAMSSKVHVLAHLTNAGKGAALLTGFRYALAQFEFDALVTLDANGEHRASDIPRLAAALRQGGELLVIGARADFRSLPLSSRWGNKIASALFRMIYPPGPQDTLSGLRALSREFVLQVVHGVNGGRYETELHMLLMAMERGHHVAQIPVATDYTEGKRKTHFNALLDSTRILWTLARAYRTKRKQRRSRRSTASDA